MNEVSTIMVINNQIMNLVLKEFQSMLRELTRYYNEDKAENYGTAPRNAIVKYHDKFDIGGHKLGKIIAAWEISLNEIEKIKDLSCEATHSPTQGMFYKEGSFLFSINSDVTEVIIEWQVGPRFGRGYLYSIVKTDNRFRIIKAKNLWIS